jgi:hypothetical protein
MVSLIFSGMFVPLRAWRKSGFTGRHNSNCSLELSVNNLQQHLSSHILLSACNIIIVSSAFSLVRPDFFPPNFFELCCLLFPSKVRSIFSFLFFSCNHALGHVICIYLNISVNSFKYSIDRPHVTFKPQCFLATTRVLILPTNSILLYEDEAQTSLLKDPVLTVQ